MHWVSSAGAGYLWAEKGRKKLGVRSAEREGESFLESGKGERRAKEEQRWNGMDFTDFRILRFLDIALAYLASTWRIE